MFFFCFLLIFNLLLVKPVQDADLAAMFEEDSESEDDKEDDSEEEEEDESEDKSVGEEPPKKKQKIN